MTDGTPMDAATRAAGQRALGILTIMLDNSSDDVEPFLSDLTLEEIGRMIAAWAASRSLFSGGKPKRKGSPWKSSSSSWASRWRRRTPRREGPRVA